MSVPRVESAVQTEPGLRPVNEDAVVSRRLPDGRWFAAVADGMGGLQAGEMASRTAVEVMLREVGNGSDLVAAVETAHRAILHEADGRPMGTTVVAALVDQRGLSIASVGDSRAYLLGPAGLVRVTKDHTVGAEAGERGESVIGDVVADSRWGRALTRSLGSAEPLRVDRFGPFRLEEGIRVLLCSDGVHEVLPDEVIEAFLRGPSDIDVTVRRLVDASLDRGSRDNVSAVLLRSAGAAGRPERLLPLEAAGDVTADPEGWDLAALVARSHNPMRRKPGRLNAVLLVVGLFLAIATMILLLRTMTG